MMKIVILDAETLSINGDIDFSIFDQYGEVTVYPFTRDEQVGERIRDAEVVWNDDFETVDIAKVFGEALPQS